MIDLRRIHGLCATLPEEASPLDEGVKNTLDQLYAAIFHAQLPIRAALAAQWLAAHPEPRATAPQDTGQVTVLDLGDLGL